MEEKMTRVSHLTGATQWARSPAGGLMATSAGWALAVLSFDRAEWAVILSGGEIEGGGGYG